MVNLKNGISIFIHNYFFIKFIQEFHQEVENQNYFFSGLNFGENAI